MQCLNYKHSSVDSTNANKWSPTIIAAKINKYWETENQKELLLLFEIDFHCC